MNSRAGQAAGKEGFARRFPVGLFLLLCLLLAGSAAAANAPPHNEAARIRGELAVRTPGAYSGVMHPSWAPLYNRLQADPGVSKQALEVFRVLPPFSAEPMGLKVREMFTNAFLRKRTPPKAGGAAPRPRIYRNMVSAATMKRCADFLVHHKGTFDAVEKKYPVPRHILVALLYVETKLGNYMGKDNALWSLACMAAADTPARVAPGIEGLPITDEHAEWLQTKLTEKSLWAYKELKAFLNFCAVNRLDGACMPGSVYGAIGICQFMPSNLEPYGDDGDGDGVINLFNEADAIFSAAKYLHKHGWIKDSPVERQRKTLKRYNNLNIYANTILTLAESVRTGQVLTGPPDSPGGKPAPAKKTPPSKKGGKGSDKKKQDGDKKKQGGDKKKQGGKQGGDKKKQGGAPKRDDKKKQSGDKKKTASKP